MMDPLAELIRAWHVRLNDQDFSSVISPEYVLDEYTNSVTPSANYRRNIVFGVELDSFALKDEVIESGRNVLELRVT